jgi:hypothetical protein
MWPLKWHLLLMLALISLVRIHFSYLYAFCPAKYLHVSTCLLLIVCSTHLDVCLFNWGVNCWNKDMVVRECEYRDVSSPTPDTP